jgi:uncharacterized protein (TIGR02594 family)
MDPEVVAQLEQQLRELSDMIANQNSMMKNQMDAMNKMGASAQAAGNSIKNSSEKSSTANTKYAEAQEKATAQTSKSEIASKALAASMGTLSASVSGLTGVFGSLGSSLLSAEQGMSKYGKVADAAAGAAEGLAKSIPIVGGALGGLVGVVGKLAAQVFTDGMKLVDTFVGMRDGLVEVGGALPVTGEQLIKLAGNAGYFGDRMQILGKITAGVGTGLASLGQTAGQGATKFMELAAVTDDTRRQYSRMGISQERLTEMQGQYVKSQEASGLSMQMQTRTAAQLRKESLAYVDNMTRLSALTGKQAEQLQAEKDQVAAQIQERMEIVKENAEIKRLKAEGRGAEAADIERRQRDRQAMMQEITAGLGPELATQAMKVIRSGYYDNISAPLANLGIDFIKYGQQIKDGTVDAKEAGRNIISEYDKSVERIGTALGAGTEALNEEQFRVFGIGNEAVGRGLTRAGKNQEAANTAAEQGIQDAKTRQDNLADAVTNLESQERKFQEAYQEQLLKGVMYLAEAFKNVDLFNIVAENFTSILKGLGAAILGVTALSGGLAIGAAALAARMAGSGAAGAAGAAGAGGGLLRGLGGLLGKAGVVGMAGAGAYGAYKGYNADPNASFGSKLLNAGSSGLNMLSFGLLGSSSDDIAAKALPAQQAALAQQLPSQFVNPQMAGMYSQEQIEDLADVKERYAQRTNVLTEEQTEANDALIGSSSRLDVTLENTNKSLKLFKELIDMLNMTLGGPDAASGGGSSSPLSMGGMGGGNDPNKILSTIRQMESGNSYTAQNPTSSASGAYQFIDSTWQSLTKKAGIGTEFKSAKDAPPAIQDQIAQMHLQEILAKSGGDISKVPTAWFTGNVQGKSSAVSPEQVQKYVQKWMGIYSGMPGGGMQGMPGMPGGQGGLIGLFQQMGGAMGNMGNMGGGGQTAALALASQYLGMNETTDRQAIAAFLKAGGAGLDPKVEAWCAAFVNSSLQQSGIRGSGSAVANSFQNWGMGVPVNQVMPGDVVLETKGKGPGQTGGHVGLGTGKYDGKRIGMLSGNSGNKVTDKMIPADGDVMVRRGTAPMAERGGILSGPDTGYPAILHGTEMIVPLRNGRTNNSRASALLSQIMNTTGERVGAIGKYSKIQDSLMSVVQSETTKAIRTISESNSPMQTMTTQISNSMRQVMEAHNKTMYELTYKLGDMIDALNTSNDVTKKILKKASA